jgi:hypothetical protein
MVHVEEAAAGGVELNDVARMRVGESEAVWSRSRWGARLGKRPVTSDRKG